MEALKEKMEEMERGHRRKIERFMEALEGMEKELNMVKREGAKAKAKLRKLNLEERDAPVEQFKRNLGGNGEWRECEIGRLGSLTPQRSGHVKNAPVCEEAANERIGIGNREESAVLSTRGKGGKAEASIGDSLRFERDDGFIGETPSFAFFRRKEIMGINPKPWRGHRKRRRWPKWIWGKEGRIGK